jgi:CRISPR-associated protein Cmr6
MSERGRVKFYNSESAYGFIKRKGKPDVHFDRDSFKGKPPVKGDEVVFDVVKQERGHHAMNLRFSTPFYESETIQYILPKDTNAIIDTQTIDNFNLKLNKVPPFEENKSDYSKSKFILLKTDKRGEVVLAVLPDYSKLAIKAIAERHKHSIEKLNIQSKSIILKPEWRMVIGLGNESVYETSMTLHHIYGIPYIPGSAIKGVVRSHIITEAFGRDEKRALEEKWFCDFFGSPTNRFDNEGRQGKLIFFDAFPIEAPKIEPDVMNVHYPDYYGGSKPPADYQNPHPIFFLTVRNSAFQFMIGIKNKDNTIIKDGAFKGQYILKVAENCVKEALSEHGIGAKTAVGYGYMNSARHGN